MASMGAGGGFQRAGRSLWCLSNPISNLAARGLWGRLVLNLHSSLCSVLFLNINSKHNVMMRKNKGERASHCFQEAKFCYQDVRCRVFLGAEWRPVQLSPPNSFSSLWFGPQTMQPETKPSVLKLPSGSTWVHKYADSWSSPPDSDSDCELFASKPIS